MQPERLNYIPKTPECLKSLTKLTPSVIETLPIETSFPHLKTAELLEFIPSSSELTKSLRVGIVFSGGPAAGGHNVLSGVFDAIKKINKESVLIGFMGGPSGIVDGQFCFLEKEKIDEVRNQGGFHLLGTGRTKIATEEALKKCKETCEELKLDGLVVIGGDDSNTNAAMIAEYFLASSCKTAVVGVPKTIDGDLKNRWIETSFGFDSASKTYSEIIGNVASDAISQGKYYFFIKVMGRTASHLVLECALQTSPNLALISEEIKEKNMTLDQVVGLICDLIIEREKKGKNFGVILIPEGLIEFIPECKRMIDELKGKKDTSGLSKESLAFFQSLPESIQKQLLLSPDPHGNIQVSKIEVERLIISLVQKQLKDINPQPLFLGYEGRCCYPSNFDCDYCYTLGMTAALLVAHKKTGYMAVIRQLSKDSASWRCQGVPLVAMIQMKEKPVIKQNLVDLKGPVFQYYMNKRQEDRLEDQYKNPGPIQFFGSLADRITATLKLESVE